MSIVHYECMHFFNAMENKIIIYQVFTRLFGNSKNVCKRNGTLVENGCGKMDFFDSVTLRRIKKLGATHIWYTGVIRHASKTDYSAYGVPSQHPAVVKGNAGSPYAITDYYDVDPDLAVEVDKRMEEFEALVERTHNMGLKVIIDFVPNHVARQYKSVAKPEGVKDLGETDDTGLEFSPGNNFYYCTGVPFEPYFDLMCGAGYPYTEFPAKATGNDHFDSHPGSTDWYETVKLNYGVDYCDAGGRSYHFDPVPDTWHKMAAILDFWAGKGVDGFRCDMAEMVPVEFWSWAIARTKAAHPGLLFIGEVYNPSLYRNFVACGFDYLYDKVGMYDCLCGVMRGGCPASAITWQWQSVDDIKDHMLYFLENHDEMRLASDFLVGDGRRGVPALVISALMGGNPYMLYAGQEFGERGMDSEGFSGRDGRTTIFDYWTVPSLYHGYVDRRKMSAGEMLLEGVYTKVLNIARTEKAVADGLFFDLMYANNDGACSFNPDRQYAFLRKCGSDVLLVAVNFYDKAVDCGIRLPHHAFEYLGLPEKRVKACDLLGGGTLVEWDLHADGFVRLTIGANGGRVYKFNV